MSNHRKNPTEMYELMLIALDGKISDEQFLRLHSLLEEDDSAVSEYVGLMMSYSVLCNQSKLLDVRSVENVFNDDGLLSGLWEALSENEKSAEVVEIERPKEAATPEQSFVEKRKIVKRQRRVSRLTLYTAICSTAALLMMILYVFMHPVLPPEQMPFVARLSGAVDAQWEDENILPAVGSDLRGGGRKLVKGLVEIEFYEGAVIIVEGPAEFDLESVDRVFLGSGRITSKVPKHAAGFTVSTPMARIVDLGTEFGTYVGQDMTEVHMFKGKASFVSGGFGGEQASMSEVITEGKAKRAYLNGRVSNIRVRPRAFAHRISGETEELWQGETLDLTDIVGGGDGYGSGKRNSGIDPASGRTVSEKTEMQRFSQGYVKVGSLPLVDGVFIPDGGDGPVQISSDGHSYDKFCDSDGSSFMSICNNSYVEMSLNDQVSLRPLSLKGMKKKENPDPVLCMHANAGITFDLEQIRKITGGKSIVAFASLCGVSETAMVTDAYAESCFFVLVDGEARFERHELKRYNGAVKIEVGLDDDDRFLTLVCTDGGSNNGDWSMFVRPVLLLE